VASLSKSLAHYNIKTGTFTLEYYLSGSRYFATSSGGTISCAEDVGTTGTIDLVNGTISVTFSAATDPNFSIRGNYTYITEETHFENGAYFEVEYLTQVPLDITEVGIENNRGLLMAYATLPLVELRKPDYHLSVQFLIKKT
jgi:hypothetical protein